MKINTRSKNASKLQLVKSILSVIYLLWNFILILPYLLWNWGMQEYSFRICSWKMFFDFMLFVSTITSVKQYLLILSQWWGQNVGKVIYECPFSSVIYTFMTLSMAHWKWLRYKISNKKNQSLQFHRIVQFLFWITLEPISPQTEGSASPSLFSITEWGDPESPAVCG